MDITVSAGSLIVLCGPAGCGKSTFARRHFKSTQIVSSDRCRALVSDDPNAQWASPAAFELFHIIISKRMRFNRLTVADSTALSKSARSRLRRPANNFNRPAVLVIFNIPMEVCIERDQSRRRVVGEEVIRKHYEQLQKTLVDIRTEPFDATYILDEEDVAKVHFHTRGKSSS